MESSGRMAMEVLLKEYISTVDSILTTLLSLASCPLTFGSVGPLFSNLVGFEEEAVGCYRKKG
ncbi:hypothetical protein Scep_007123 [Stephania cephalantha]|uniref:Uncharacterized protein n=1 Tax=Stephania cephalantha TaxID=152367 RepID=A0AAP0K9F5_9MAGN